MHAKTFQFQPVPYIHIFIIYLRMRMMKSIILLLLICVKDIVEGGDFVKYHVFMQDEKEENKLIHIVVEGFEAVEEKMQFKTFVGYVNEFQFKDKERRMLKCR